MVSEALLGAPSIRVDLAAGPSVPEIADRYLLVSHFHVSQPSAD
jgi:hypothetical protein